MGKGQAIAAAALAGLCFTAGGAFACASQTTVPGHWEWQGNGHVWVPAHPTLPPRAYASSDVRDAADQRDQRNAADQPRDLDRRFAR